MTYEAFDAIVVDFLISYVREPISKDNITILDRRIGIHGCVAVAKVDLFEDIVYDLAYSTDSHMMFVSLYRRVRTERCKFPKQSGM